jgi:hypothetical protein
MSGTCSTHGEIRNAFKILGGKPEEKRPLRRPRHKWGNNIKVDLRDIGWECVDWIDKVLDRDSGGGLL